MAWGTAEFAAVIATMSAAFAGWIGYRNYWINSQNQEDAKADERILAGVPVNPSLDHHAHSRCVLQCTLVNKSKRKAVVSRVDVYDRKGERVPAAWSNEISSVGNPKEVGELISITDAVTLFVRRSDGKDMGEVTLKVFHSFPDSPLVIKFDPLRDFLRDS